MCVLYPLNLCVELTERAQRYALESGVTTINGKVARPDTIIRNGDRIECVCASVLLHVF